MRRGRWLDRRIHLFGGSLPVAVALLIGATFVCSILGARLPGVIATGALIPGDVFVGELWRLVSWVFFERDPLGLIFAALALFWFGNDLVRIWGPLRFLAAYLGLAAGAAGVTCGAAWLLPGLLPGLRLHPFVGPWPVVSALIIAWASAFPTRNILLYFVVPLSGRNLIYATLGGTLIFALLGGIANFIPHFAAQLIALAALRGTPLGQVWARVKFELAYRGWRRRANRLREVPRPSRDEPTRWYH